MQQDSNIYDNNKRSRLRKFFEEYIDEKSVGSFVSAYFTVHAYYELKEEFDKMDKLRFLFGEPQFVQKVADFLHYRNVVIEDEEMKIPIDKSVKQSVTAKACAEWIRNKVEIRSIKKPNFLHGKAYIVEYPQLTKRDPKGVIGSSNFTYKGLGCGKNSNMELNLRLSDDRDVKEVLSWFNEVWGDKTMVEDVKEEVLKSIEQLSKDNTPEFIYHKTLYHVFEELTKEDDKGLLPFNDKHLYDSEIWKTLYDFQKDAVRGITNRIEKFGGCILADGVGLGKTYEALAVIKYYNKKRHKVLVLCPKKLKTNWTLYCSNYETNKLRNDDLRYDVLAHTDLSREKGYAGGIDLEQFAWSDYDLIVIDESHNFRNSKKTSKDSDGEERFTRYGRLMEDVLKPGVETKVLLLSATPVNNKLSDLTSQINLICKDDDTKLREHLNINGLDYIMRTAQAKFNDWTELTPKPNEKKIPLASVMDNEFFKLLDNISIARSRRHIVAKYQDTLDKIGNFPTKQPPISISTDIDTDNEFPDYDTLYKKIEKFKLHLYKPAQFVSKEFYSQYAITFKRKEQFENQATSEKYLTMMMRVNYLKRLESSVDSFKLSAFRTLEKYDNVIAKLEAFMDPDNQEYIDQLNFDLEFGELDEESQEEIEDQLTIGKKLKYELKHFDKEKYLSALKNDREVLKAIHDKSEKVTPERDVKLLKLKELITKKIETKKNKGNKKVLIFTAFSDTANYLYDNIKQWARDKHSLHSAIIAGGSSNNQTTLKTNKGKAINNYEEILINFSPKAKGRKSFAHYPKEEIDILIATDCISEGQNLQDCDYVVNYDIHWNPVRIIQRFGRIDRIGSQNETIQMVNFWPTNDLDKYINLKNRVRDRMRLVDLTGPGAETALTKAEAEAKDSDKNDYRLRLLEKLKDETITFDDEEEGSFSLSEYSLQDFRVDLTNFVESNRERLHDAPLGLFAVVPTTKSNLGKSEATIQPGAIFCVRHKNLSKTNQKALDKINQISPYYLIYILESGDVKFNFTYPHQILEIYSKLCKGEKEVYKNLCEAFNNELEIPEALANYTKLLSNSCNAIMARATDKNAQQLTQQRDAILFDEEVTTKYLNNFELITWLIIKEENSESNN